MTMRAASIAMLLAVAAPLRAQHLEGGGPVPAGDPTLAFENGEYFLFSSGPGAPIFRSRDLVTWRPAGRVFEKLPGWASDAVPGSRGSVWAPEISRIGGEYRLYWSTSTPGSRRSVIGLAVNRALDPASPEYRWVDRGKVIETFPEDDWNAIDPQGFVDRDGKAWLAMGSYWSGIKLRRVDEGTGMLSPEDPALHPLAARPGVDPPSIEGALVMGRDGWYYLWVSFDRCHRNIHGNYNIRVGRSRKVTGPYADRDGRAMLDGGGTLVLAGHGDVRGPGHNSIFEGGGRTWMVHHRFDPAHGGARTLQVRPVFWDDEGWPLAGEPVGTGAAAGPAKPEGRWSYSLDFAEPLEIRLEEGGRIGLPGSRASWKVEADRIILTWPRSGDDGRAPLVERCFLGPDGAWFAGRNAHGQVVRGRRLGD